MFAKNRTEDNIQTNLHRDSKAGRELNPFFNSSYDGFSTANYQYIKEEMLEKLRSTRIMGLDEKAREERLWQLRTLHKHKQNANSQEKQKMLE